MTKRPLRLKKPIARKVRDLRTERRLTQHELAERLGLSQSRLSELERGAGSFTAEQLKLEELAVLVRDALVGESARHLTALAPVLANNAEHVAVLARRLVGSGLERRLGWVIENTLAALREGIPSLPRGPLLRRHRRAEVLLESSARWLSQHAPPEGATPLIDILDPVATKRSAEEIEASASAISRRWGILSAIQPQEFADALRAAREDR